MYRINKITSNSVVDHAAEEMRKYLRMMMPEGGDVSIAYAPDAEDGFRLGLMQDFGLDVSDVENTELPAKSLTFKADGKDAEASEIMKTEVFSLLCENAGRFSACFDTELCIEHIVNNIGKAPTN